MRDPYAIRTLEELRSILGEPNPYTHKKLKSQIGEQARAFLARSPLVLMATAGRDGELSVTPRGDACGFVLVEDERTIVLPERTGNKLAFALQHILDGSRVGLLALVPGTGETLRLSGTAELTRDPALLEKLSARGKPALLAIRVRVERCYFHCAKAILRSQLWQPESWPAPLAISFGLEMDERIRELIDGRVAEGYRRDL